MKKLSYKYSFLCILLGYFNIGNSQELYFLSLIQGEISKVNQVSLGKAKQAHFSNPSFISSLDFVVLAHSIEDNNTDVYQFDVLEKSAKPITQTPVNELSLKANKNLITYNTLSGDYKKNYIELNTRHGDIVSSYSISNENADILQCVNIEKHLYCVEDNHPLKNLVKVDKYGKIVHEERNIAGIDLLENELVYLKEEYGTTTFLTYPRKQRLAIIPHPIKAFTFVGNQLLYTVNGKVIYKKSEIGPDSVFIDISDKLKNKEILEFTINENLNQVLIVTSK